jgi:hypothetical protein
VLFQADPGVHGGDGSTVRSDGGYSGEFEDRVRGALKFLDIVLSSVTAWKDHPGGDVFGIGRPKVHGFREHEREVVAEALMNLLEAIVNTRLLKGVVDLVDKRRDGRGRRSPRGEAVGDRICRDAFYKARRLLPRSRDWGKRSWCGLEVGMSNRLEKSVSRSPRELLRDPFVAGNGVLDSFGGLCGSCLFGPPGLRCWRGSRSSIRGGSHRLRNPEEPLQRRGNLVGKCEESFALPLVLGKVSNPAGELFKRRIGFIIIYFVLDSDEVKGR